MYHKQTSLNKPSRKQIIQEIVSPEVSKLNHVVTNKKQDEMQFSLEKKTRKTKKDSFTLVNSSPPGIYLLKVNDRNTRTRCELYSNLTMASF